MSELYHIFLNNQNIIDMDAEEVSKLLKPIDGVEVKEVFQDDGVTSFHVSYLVEGKWYDYKHYWVGDMHRMFYQSEISQEIRDNELRNFIAQEILDHYSNMY